MRTASLISLFLIVFPTPLSPGPFYELIVWNVGQGLFATLIEGSFCRHFDMGGEFPPSRKLLQSRCLGRTNEVYFSHWDKDHVNLTTKMRAVLPSLCVAAWPGGSSRSPRAVHNLRLIPECPHEDQKLVQEIIWRKSSNSSNSQSRIWIKRGILFPGDSDSNQEKYWVPKIRNKLRLWILGHHGSRTSSQSLLVSKFSKGSMAIASARYARYRHPHQEVVARLRFAGIPVARTEFWGHLIFEMTPR